MLDRNFENALNLTEFQRKRKDGVISAILLGAGESKRMKIDKLHLPWGRGTVLEHCLDTLLRSTVDEVIVVLRPQSEAFEKRLQTKSAQLRKRVKIVVNQRYRLGMSSSIREGLRAINPKSEGVLIGLGDQPFLRTRTIDLLLRSFREGRGEIIVPSFRGKKGHPVIFHRKFKRELLQLRGDIGGRSLLTRHPADVKTIPVSSEGVITDIDTWEEYRRALRRKRRVDEKGGPEKTRQRSQ